jgi:hypothetical protein
MPRQQARPQDYTGRQREAGAKARDEQTKRETEITMATARAEREAVENEVIDLTVPEPADTVETGPVEVLPATRKITMNTTLEDTTYGRGAHGPNTMTLEEGRTYILPREHADHLDRLGFVHH